MQSDLGSHVSQTRVVQAIPSGDVVPLVEQMCSVIYL
jgi:hypothetical protein